MAGGSKTSKGKGQHEGNFLIWQVADPNSMAAREMGVQGACGMESGQWTLEVVSEAEF